MSSKVFLIDDTVQAKLDDLYRNEAHKVYASLILLLGDFDLVEIEINRAAVVAMGDGPQARQKKLSSLWSR